MEDTKKLLDLLMTQDISETYAKKMIALGQNNMLVGESDHLTVYIINSFLERDDMEDFERDIDYAIDSLRRLKRKI